ncbi:hypothetical protein [Microcoleus sp. herbarium12]|uniref:hypothetical protein n=1 Tax=Microcoleus sp. herbarium12 TaxID=3055437 RepID=UPI002FD05BAC
MTIYIFGLLYLHGQSKASETLAIGFWIGKQLLWGRSLYIVLLKHKKIFTPIYVPFKIVYYQKADDLCSDRDGYGLRVFFLF